MMNKRRNNKNIDKAIKIFLELYDELQEQNGFRTDNFIPVYLIISTKGINNDVIYHLEKIIEQQFLYFNYSIYNDENTNEELIKFELGKDPLNDNIIDINDYRLNRKKK